MVTIYKYILPDQIDRSADQSTWPHGSSISVSMTAMTLFSCNWYSDTEVKLKNFCLLLQIRKRFCLHLNSVEKHIKERKTTDILIYPLFPTFWIIAVLGFVFTNYRIGRGGETKALQIKPFVFDLRSLEIRSGHVSTCMIFQKFIICY